MIKSAQNKPVSELLSVDSNWRFRVPRDQREYSGRNLPQGPNIPSCWVKMIADGDEDKAREYRDKYAHQLGNLTITGYNSKLGNKLFEEKCDRKDLRGRYVGYKNGFLTKICRTQAIGPSLISGTERVRWWTLRCNSSLWIGPFDDAYRGSRTARLRVRVRDCRRAGVQLFDCRVVGIGVGLGAGRRWP